MSLTEGEVMDCVTAHGEEYVTSWVGEPWRWGHVWYYIYQVVKTGEYRKYVLRIASGDVDPLPADGDYPATWVAVRPVEVTTTKWERVE